MVILTSVCLIIFLNKTGKFTSEEDNTKITLKILSKQKHTLLNFALFLISFITIAIIQTAIMNYMPTILQRDYSMDSSISGILTSLPMIVSIFSSLLFGYICDKFATYKYIYIIGCALIGPGAFLMFNFSGALFLVGLILLGIGLGAPAVSANAVFEILKPELHSVGIGFGMATFSLGQVLGTNLTQAILSNSFSNVFGCSLFLLITGIAGTIIGCFSKTIK